MVKYIDKDGVVYKGFLDFREKHPGIICPEHPSERVLALLGLQKKEDEDPTEVLEFERAVALRRLQLNFLSFRANDATVKSSLGFVADATERALMDVRGLCDLTEGSSEPIGFMDAENKLHPLTHDQLVVLRNEIALNGSKVYGVKWAYRQKILEAKTVEEIKNLPVEFQNAE